MSYSTIRRLHAYSGTTLSERTYWAVFWMILSAGLGLRLYWASVLILPFIAPDSGTYIGPALYDPMLPITQVRTAGFPYLIVAGLGLFGHPIGIIFVHNFLWLISSVLIVYALKRVVGLKVLGLFLLAYLSFVEKNLVFEFFVLSEHSARTLYLLSVSMMLLSMRSSSFWMTQMIALIVLLNILVKPSALAIVPAVGTFFLINWLYRRTTLRKLATNMTVFACLITVPLLGYMAIFEQRLGEFTISYYGGYNFFAHVGHFTNLESDLHAEVKRDLKKIMPTYIEKYVSQGKLRPNWMIHGSFDKELREDFGDVSPQSIILSHANQSARVANRIFQDLAIEGILANKGPYAVYVLKTVRRLLLGGLTFSYGDFFSGETPARARSREKAFVDWFKSSGNDNWLRVRARNGLKTHWSGLIAQQKSDQRMTRIVSEWVTGLSHLFKGAVIALGAIALVVLIIFVPMGLWGLARRKITISRPGVLSYRGTLLAAPATLLAALALVGTTVTGYILAISMYLVSDSPRFLLNIQDLLVVSAILIVALALRQARRLLAVMARRARARTAPLVPS